ncbi:MAG: hypothetical protein HRU70_08790 [Phycisphaeraceae bacterium]|nr:MAG: hypothetical protein HRU70_08790 [Phycisphaeraceae bacterium]
MLTAAPSASVSVCVVSDARTMPSRSAGASIPSCCSAARQRSSVWATRRSSAASMHAGPRAFSASAAKPARLRIAASITRARGMWPEPPPVMTPENTQAARPQDLEHARAQFTDGHVTRDGLGAFMSSTRFWCTPQSRSLPPAKMGRQVNSISFRRSRSCARI